MKKLFTNKVNAFVSVTLLLTLAYLVVSRSTQEALPTTATVSQSATESKTETVPSPTVASPIIHDVVATPAPQKKGAALKPALTQKVQPALAFVENHKEATEDREEEEKEDEAAELKNEADRWEAEFNMLKDPKTGQIPRGIHQKGITAAKKVRTLQLPAELSEDGLTLRTLPTITTTVRGPNNYGGRTRAIAFDRRNTQRIFAGAVSGGLFKSENGGSSWTRVTPAGIIHNITAIAQDSLQPDTWYFGTGETNSSAHGGTGASYLGFGMWKSTDNGLTWTALANTQSVLERWNSDWDLISRIVVNPRDRSVLAGAGEAVYRSTDFGENWTQVLGNDATGIQTDIIFNVPSNTFYAAINGSIAEGGIYKSTDGGAMWTKIRTPAELLTGDKSVKRIVLSNVGATANIIAMYEITANFNITCTGTPANTSKAGLQLYDATANTWTDHSQKISNCATGTSNPKVISLQNGYNMCITTKPDDGDYVYLGGTEIYRLRLSTGDYQYIGGDQGAAGADNLHVDNHLLIFEPGSTTKMWACNDGGMRYTDVTGTITQAPSPTGGYKWNDRNANYISYQYYRADINPTNGSNFLAGAAQDNASTIQHSTAEAKEIDGGDGMCIGIISGSSFTDYNVILSTQNGALRRRTGGGFNTIVPTGASDLQGFRTYFLLDADNTNYLYFPTKTKQLYRTRNAANITTTAVGDVTTGWEEITGVAATIAGTISAMAVTRNIGMGDATYSASNADRKMYMGTENGKVYRLADPAFTAVGSTPTEITPSGVTVGQPNAPNNIGFVSDIAVNPNNDKEVMVTYSNYNTTSIWHTLDASVATPAWTNIDGPAGSAVELAAIRSAMIVRTGGTTLYIVGTSTGLYGTMTLSGATTVWERIAPNEIGLSPSVSMRLRTSDNKMVLGTHGNGLFMLAFPSSTLPLDLLSFKATKNNANVELKWVSANEVGFSHYNVQKSNDGKLFIPFAKVSATGAGTYQTVDEKPSAGQNYYRLEMVDTDGKRRYSNTINVTFDTKGTTMSIYPNPVEGAALTVDMSVNNDTEFTFTITYIAGRTRLTSQQKAVQGTNQLPLDISTLEKGIYFISTKNATTQEVLRTMRFIKQ